MIISMKITKYIALSSVMALSLTSCNDWLDVNVNPDQPNNESILVENRLPWIQKMYTYSAGCANTRTFATCGGFYSNNGNMNAVSVTWAGAAGLTTTPYQDWFVAGASNIPDLINKAEKDGAYHYAGAAKVVYALGFMQMADLYGEMPFSQALGASPAPEYDNGKDIYEGCLAALDEALEYFNMTQSSTATPLSAGDMWCGGDVNKWIKLVNGLKARWLLRVTKKSTFDPEAVLAALDKAPQSNEDNIYMACYNSLADVTDFLTGDPVMTNGNWDTAAYGKNQWVSQYYLDLLTNLRGAGVEDPRVDKIIPSSMTNVTLDESGHVKSYEWRRSKGIDIFGDAERLRAGGATSIQVQRIALKPTVMSYPFDKNHVSNQPDFEAGVASNGYVKVDVDSAKNLKGRQYMVKDTVVSVCYPAGAWYVDANNYVYAGDTAYVNLCSGAQKTNNGTWGMPVLDTYYHSNFQDAAVAGAVSGTGSFQIYCVSDYEVLTYAEMCFIKAEVLMRKGDSNGALTAYKAGIKANMDCMQNKLNQWKGAGYDNPGMQPMDEAAIESYMTSGAVAQSAGELTMSDIMLQKYIAMGWSLENWVDMRRFNYSAGNIGSFGVVYPGYTRPKLFTGGAALTGSTPDDPSYFFRRWRLPSSLELNYNLINAKKMNANCTETFIWGIPVWWDCATDEEYFNYLK